MSYQLIRLGEKDQEKLGELVPGKIAGWAVHPRFELFSKRFYDHYFSRYGEYTLILGGDQNIFLGSRKGLDNDFEFHDLTNMKVSYEEMAERLGVDDVKLREEIENGKGSDISDRTTWSG